MHSKTVANLGETPLSVHLVITTSLIYREINRNEKQTVRDGRRYCEADNT